MGQDLAKQAIPVDAARLGCGVEAGHVQGSQKASAPGPAENQGQLSSGIADHPPHQGRIAEMEQAGRPQPGRSRIHGRESVVGARMMQEDPIDAGRAEHDRIGRLIAGDDSQAVA